MQPPPFDPVIARRRTDLLSQPLGLRSPPSAGPPRARQAIMVSGAGWLA